MFGFAMRPPIKSIVTYTIDVRKDCEMKWFNNDWPLSHCDECNIMMKTKPGDEPY